MGTSRRRLTSPFSSDASALGGAAKAVHENPMYLLLSRNVEESEAMLERFNEGLRRLKESGRYDQIIADALAGIYTKPK